MKRLMEKMVFSGFVIACRFATWPTRVSPSFVNATTEGVRRLPSWLAMTVGSPPSTTATTELVVPRSMPITFAMCHVSLNVCPESPGRASCGTWRGRRWPSPPGLCSLRHVDLDLLGLELLDLGERDRQHAVAIAGLDLVGLHRHREREVPLELPVPPLAAVVVLLLHVVIPLALPADGEHLAGDRQVDLLLVETGEL